MNLEIYLFKNGRLVYIQMYIDKVYQHKQLDRFIMFIEERNIPQRIVLGNSAAVPNMNNRITSALHALFNL